MRMNIINRVLTAAVIPILLCACSYHAAQIIPLQEVQESIVPNKSTLPVYELTGGVWVKNKPLFVNHDFDFGMAMAVPDIGPAIAAGTRIKKNKETAELFTEKLDLEGAIVSKGRLIHAEHPIRIYGVLYGHPKALLRIIMEFLDSNDQPPLRFVFVTEAHALQGENSWSADNGMRVRVTFEEAIPYLTSLWTGYKDGAEPNENVEYSVQADATKKGTGSILSENAERIIIKTSMIKNTIFSYPRSLVAFEKRKEVVKRTENK